MCVCVCVCVCTLTRAGHAEGVAYRHGAAIHVHFRRVYLQKILRIISANVYT